jgi:DNA-binding NarL/FixJ family response regulator
MSAAVQPVLCATAACHAEATTTHGTWPMCTLHAQPEPQDRTRSWHAYTTLRTWIGRLHHAGLTDTDIAAVVGVSPGTVRAHRRRLGLTAHRTAAQRTRDNRRAQHADSLISHCPSCNTWRWDSHCTRCAAHEVAS